LSSALNPTHPAAGAYSPRMSNAPPHTPPPAAPRAAARALWRMAQAFLTTLFKSFGEPQDIAAAHTLAAREHGPLARWLRAGEALMRRLLFLEAAALLKNDPGLPSPLQGEEPQRAKRVRVRKVHAFYADRPEDWRVSFRCFPSSATRTAAARARTPSLQED